MARVYVRSVNECVKCSLKFLCVKTRVAPLKGVTIPRLKLNVSLLLAELINKVTGNHGGWK